jgi:uncharacterized protein
LHFHVLLTTACDLHCKYCYESSIDDINSEFRFNIDYSLPKECNYDINLLAKFCERDPQCVLAFYGGEPTLCRQRINNVIDNVKARKFILQTNALHLDEIESKYVNKIHTILASIDGCPELTDYYRGKQVYQKVVKNLRIIKNNGFDGEIIARMTIMEETDIFKEVQWLLNNRDFSFDSIHWQINAGFWQNDYEKRPFRTWIKDNYNPGIRHLVKFWVDKMGETGEVIKLYPFLGITLSLLKDETNLLRCGSGWANYSILTDGSIVPCPAMSGMKDFHLGHISYSDPLKLEKIFVQEPCTHCKLYSLCGGRCLYANITRRWSTEAYALVCETVENLIATLQRELPRIQQLISHGKVSLSNFDYQKYKGVEIIP